MQSNLSLLPAGDTTDQRREKQRQQTMNCRHLGPAGQAMFTSTENHVRMKIVQHDCIEMNNP